jgi:predicted kinase
VLIILSGLPGVGKTSIARAVALELGGIHIRIDALEQAIRATGTHSGPMDDAGYRTGYALAEEHLQRGRTVVADSVNPLPITREAWRQVGARARARVVEIEIVCSDAVEHRRRVEARQPDIEGFILPTWNDVIGRQYEPWDGDRVLVDTAGQTPAASVKAVLDAIEGMKDMTGHGGLDD